MLSFIENEAVPGYGIYERTLSLNKMNQAKIKIY
jgi:hypothetical protein